MDKPIAAIELGSKKLKLVVGYEIDGQVYVLYTLTKPYGNCIEGGNFIDANKVAETIGSIREFTDPSAKLRLNISDVLLCLPPYGLGIYQTRQVTTVVTEDSKISNLDIKNIYALIRNSAYPLNDKAWDYNFYKQLLMTKIQKIKTPEFFEFIKNPILSSFFISSKS